MLFIALAAAAAAHASDAEVAAPAIDWTTGGLELASASALALGPEVLFVADPRGAAIVAIQLRPNTGPPPASLNVDDLDGRLAASMGTTRDQVRIHDLAVDPKGRAAYVSLTRGGGEAAQVVLARVTGPESIEILDHGALAHQRFELENAPAPDDGGRRSKRAQSITDLVFEDGTLYVAGLSNEEFSSKLRALSWPFDQTGSGTSVEIYHAAHGAWETHAPVRTMVAIDVGGEANLLCGYTCTPLVKVPLRDVAGGEKFVGTTVAELGNRNTPLDMVVYEKDGQRFVLIANTSRGVMKVSTEGLAEAEGLTERVERGGRAGLAYETIEALADVTQLAALDPGHAVVLVETDAGATLKTVPLP